MPRLSPSPLLLGRLAALVAATLIAGLAATGVTPARGHSASAGVPLTADPVVFPADPRGLPAPGSWGQEIDPAASYSGQLACAATSLPGVVKLRALALSTYGRGGSSPAAPRPCASGGTSEHKDGRAWDWMLNVADAADRRAAADFLGWLTGPGPSGVRGEMARRLGVMYVIYNKQSWASYRGSWQPYDGYDPHTSHIHISLSWNGARGHTSFWTGDVWPTDYGPCQIFTGAPAIVPGSRARLVPCKPAVASPRTSSSALAWLGTTGTGVRTGQSLLGVTADGVFGTATRDAVLRYQRTHDLPRTGAFDKPTWASLQPQSRQQNAPSWTPQEAASWAVDVAGAPLLRRGSAGRTVFALQTALRLPDGLRTGFYGARTAAAVLQLKDAHGLSHTPAVTPEVWDLLPAG